ncbi:MAG: GNAT family N-acetyltransferase [Methanobacteriales archaeon HGW-Methanobacteriales-2]|nr:MAG: GNAT family N-acetyltransferase [Methanobacteriales archaeon HGW-Methanobacteriales-2]
MEDKKDLIIREAEKRDASVISNYIRALAEYEGELQDVKVTPERLEEYMFDKGWAKALIAEIENKPIGFALYHYSFSTFLGKPGIALVDLYIEPEHRNKGYGKTVLSRLAKIAVDEDFERLEWWVHDWNHDAAKRYISWGANPIENIRVYRLTEKNLVDFSKLAKFHSKLSRTSARVWFSFSGKYCLFMNNPPMFKEL